nr:ribonuclease H-like domain-containing protein [Tanacetum cinerariifolium]
LLVTKPHNKTPYELLLGRTSSIRFMRPFGCPVTILNTLDALGKFDGKADEGFLVGYSINRKAFRVFNQPNVAGSGPKWLFDIDTLTQSMNYQPVVARNQPHHNADPSNYPDDPNMPALEDIIYSDDEKDVGAEADLSNLETNISISLIPTT